MRNLLLGVLGIALACKPAPQFTPPPPEVAFITVAPKSIEQVFEFSGEVEASKSVQVRSQVGGVIVERPFREGQAVQAGQVLYRIDPTNYDADLRGAQGRLAEAEARKANAASRLQRLTALVRDNAISKQDYDNAVAESRAADAAVESARGALDRSRKAFNDASVKAEISGRVGETHLELGARVRGPEDVLTTIDVLDPVYLAFRPSGQQLLAWRRNPAINRLLQPGSALKIEAILPDGRPAPQQGKLGFIDPVMDPATGTQEFRAVLPNPDRLLLPGQFVRVRLLGITRDSAILIPQRAVLQAMGRQSVYVVGPGDTLKVHDVTATSWQGHEWLIEQGLSPGDRVVVEGVQKAFPGTKVRPVPVKDSTAQAPPAGARPQ